MACEVERTCVLEHCKQPFTCDKYSKRKYCDEHKGHRNHFGGKKDHGCVFKKTNGRYQDAETMNNYMKAKKQQEAIQRAWG